MAALILQFAITVPAAMAAGRSLAAPIVFYFSFFTILTNFAAVFAHAATLFGAGRRSGRRPSFFARPRARAGISIAMAAVFIVSVTVLAPLWEPQGLFLLCDVLLHYVMPILFVVWWLSYGADGTTRLGDIPLWLIYPDRLSRLCADARAGRRQGPLPLPRYPGKGAASVAFGVAGVALMFAALGALAVLADTSAGARRGRYTGNQSQKERSPSR